MCMNCDKEGGIELHDRIHIGSEIYRIVVCESCWNNIRRSWRKDATLKIKGEKLYDELRQKLVNGVIR